MSRETNSWRQGAVVKFAFYGYDESVQFEAIFKAIEEIANLTIESFKEKWEGGYRPEENVFKVKGTFDFSEGTYAVL